MASIKSANTMGVLAQPPTLAIPAVAAAGAPQHRPTKMANLVVITIVAFTSSYGIHATLR